MPEKSGIKNHWGYRSLSLAGDAAHNLAVNTGTGNLVVSVTDAVSAARIPAMLMRTYNSEDKALSGILGKGWRFGFEEKLEVDGNNVKYIDTTGAEFTWTWNGSTFTRPPGVFSDLTLDALAREYTITMPNGFSRVFDDTTGLLKQYADANGNVLTFSRTGPNVDSVKINAGDPAQTLIDFTYTAGLVTARLNEEDGYIWQFAVDVVSGLLTQVTDPEGNVWSYTYVATGLNADKLEKIYDPRENATTPTLFTKINYDASLGGVTSIDDVESNSISFGYEGTTTITTTITDRRNNVTINTHDGTTFALEAVELPTGTVNTTTTFTWTDLTLTAVEDNLHRTTGYTYDTNGNVTLITDTNSDETAMEYDPDNNLTSITTPLGLETKFTYDDQHRRNLLSIERPLGQVTLFTYDTNGDQLSVTDPEGQRTEYTYDVIYGQLLTSSQVLDEGSAEDRLISSYGYLKPGRWLGRIVNPSGLAEEYEYDLIGRMTASLQTDGERQVRTEFEYDECGNLTKLIQPQDSPNQSTTYTYTDQSWLKTVKLPETSTACSSEYGYDAAGNLTSSIQHLDVNTSYTTTFTYDALNRLTKTKLPVIGGVDDSEYELAYDEVNNLLSRTDAEGAVVCYSYTDLNQVQFETGPLADLKFEYKYDLDGRLTEIIGQPDGPLGYSPRSFKYGYDDNDRLIYVEDPLLNQTIYEYYANDQLKSTTLPLQVEEAGPASRTYFYDSAGRLLRMRDALGHTMHYSYRRDGRLLSKTNPESQSTSYTYDELGRTTRVDYPAEAYTTFAYDDNSNVIEVAGPGGFKTSYSYDARNRLSRMIRHDLTVEPEVTFVTEYAYDQLDQILSILDPRDMLAEYSYDAHGRLTDRIVDVNHGGVVDGFNYHAQHEYDLNGRVTKFIQPDAGEVEYEYDALGRVIKLTDQIGGEVLTTYDLWGKLIRRQFQDLSIEDYTYDELGRVTVQQNNLGEQFTYSYDANGNNTGLIAPYDLTSEFSYNQRNELIMTASYATSDPVGERVIENFAYTPNGRVKTYGGPQNEQWNFTYDDLGRWTEASSSLGSKAIRAYNPSNTLAKSTGLEGLSFEMTYNGLRERTTTKALNAEAPNETAYAWEYLDLSRVEEPDGKRTDFLRDRLGRITREIVTQGEDSEITTYEYNWRGQVTEKVLPDSLVTETYVYDHRGLNTSISYSNPASQVTYEYDKRGRQSVAHYPENVERRYYYNLAGRMISDSIKDSDGNFYATYYSYDRAGNRVTQILDRKYPTSNPMPAIIPSDEHGNPLISTSGSTGQPPVTNYNVVTFDGYSADHAAATIEVQTKSVVDPNLPDQKIFAYQTGSPGTRYGEQYNTWIDPISGDTTIVIDRDPLPQEELMTLSGSWTTDPPDASGTPNIKDSKLNLDFMGRVAVEATQLAATSVVDDQTDNGKECCGKTALAQTGTPLAADRKRRASVKEAMTFNKDLLTAGSGSMNQLSPPWDHVMDPSGDTEQHIMIAYNPELEGRDFIGELMAHNEKVTFEHCPRCGKSHEISTTYDAAKTTSASFGYDSFGRLTHVDDDTVSPRRQRDYLNDWLSGNMVRETDPVNDDTWAYSHAPGHSRIAIAYVPEEFQQDLLLRGPHGQVKWRVDADGVITDYYGYSSWGNRTDHNVQSGGGITPPYLDGDLAPVPAFSQYKSSAGTDQDMTPMLGSLDGPKESGAAGQGASGNPDGAKGGNATFLQNDSQNGFSDYLPDHGGASLPGFAQSNQPMGAPPVAQDQASYADQRLSGMWGTIDGFSPGGQLGSDLVDDRRNPRMPLGATPAIAYLPESLQPEPMDWGAAVEQAYEGTANVGWFSHLPQHLQDRITRQNERAQANGVGQQRGVTLNGSAVGAWAGLGESNGGAPAIRPVGGSVRNGTGSGSREAVGGQQFGGSELYYSTGGSSGSSVSSDGSFWGKVKDNLEAVWTFAKAQLPVLGVIEQGVRAVGRAGRAVADAYNSLPWQVKVGIELGVALLEPTAFGEGAFVARWGAKLGWKWLAKYGDDAIRGLCALGRNAKNVAKGAAKAAGGVVDDLGRLGRRAAADRGGYVVLPDLNLLGKVYKGVVQGSERYIGQTNSLARRTTEHGRRFSSLMPLNEIHLEKWQRLGIEQEMYERAALVGHYLQNKRSPIALTNKIYSLAVRFGREFVESNGLKWM